jgi:hypothetical protein
LIIVTASYLGCNREENKKPCECLYGVYYIFHCWQFITLKFEKVHITRPICTIGIDERYVLEINHGHAFRVYRHKLLRVSLLPIHNTEIWKGLTSSDLFATLRFNESNATCLGCNREENKLCAGLQNVFVCDELYVSMLPTW